MKVEYSNIDITNDLIICKVIEPDFVKVKRRTIDRDHPKNKGKDPQKDEMVTTDVVELVPTDIQLCEVLNVAKENKFGILVGDQIVVNMSRLRKLDMWSAKEAKTVKRTIEGNVYGISQYEIFGIHKSYKAV
jgi:hypothetical protein